VTRPAPALCRTFLRHVVMAAGICALPLPALALVPDFRTPATPTAERREGLATYQLPTGAWRDGVLPARVVEGEISQTAWRIEGREIGTLSVLSGLRDQIAAAGYVVLFECDTLNCGGYDFRYATETLPEPEMHVDLGDFRFLSAERQGAAGPEVLSLMVSRSADRGFVQLTLVAPELTTPPVLTASTKSPEAEPEPRRPASPQSALALALQQGQTVALEDLVFNSGAAALKDGRYASLSDLADWIGADPDRRITLVGHTDSSGSTGANVALSLARAESVRQALVDGFGIAPERIATRGDGPAAPRADNATPEGRAQNRRVEVEPTPTL
jgi:outer membrane protein OmpA-like peptidoglycan-associated protein